MRRDKTIRGATVVGLYNYSPIHPVRLCRQFLHSSAVMRRCNCSFLQHFAYFFLQRYVVGDHLQRVVFSAFFSLGRRRVTFGFLSVFNFDAKSPVPTAETTTNQAAGIIRGKWPPQNVKTQRKEVEEGGKEEKGSKTHRNPYSVAAPHPPCPTH